MFTNTHISGRFFYSTSRSASVIHTQVAVYWRFVYWWHTHAHAWLLAQTHISPSRLQERFPCGVTRNWRTYFTRVWRAFLVETFVLQTTVRYPGVERSFSSFVHCFVALWASIGGSIKHYSIYVSQLLLGYSFSWRLVFILMFMECYTIGIIMTRFQKKKI